MEKIKVDELVDALPKEKTIQELFNECFVDLDKPVKPLDVLVYVGLDEQGNKAPVMTRGEYSCIYGASKSKKSFLETLIESAFIGGNTNIYSDHVVGNRRTNGYVVSCDTEQGEFYAVNAFRRVERIVGDRYDKYVPLKMRKQSVKDRIRLIEWTVNKSKYAGKIDMLFIDGLADLVSNTNDIEVSTELAEKLLRWSAEGIHICFVLHKNPGSQKARGHLGSVVTIKAESCISMDRLVDENGEGEKNTVKISCSHSRGRDFEPFYLTVNKEGLPFTHSIETDNEFTNRIADYEEKPLENVDPKNAFNDVPF